MSNYTDFFPLSSLDAVGTTMVFYQTTSPVGWVKVVDPLLDIAGLRLVTSSAMTAGATGTADGFASHGHSESASGSHAHSETSAGSHTPTIASGGGHAHIITAAGSHTHVMAAGGGSHTHTTGSTANGNATHTHSYVFRNAATQVATGGSVGAPMAAGVPLGSVGGQITGAAGNGSSHTHTVSTSSSSHTHTNTAVGSHTHATDIVVGHTHIANAVAAHTHTIAASGSHSHSIFNNTSPKFINVILAVKS